VSTISIAEWPHMPISGLPEFGQGVPFGLVAPIERRHNATAGIDPRPAIRSGFVCGNYSDRQKIRKSSLGSYPPQLDF
jgi:hypothetical protein